MGIFSLTLFYFFFLGKPHASKLSSPSFSIELFESLYSFTTASCPLHHHYFLSTTSPPLPVHCHCLPRLHHHHQQPPSSKSPCSFSFSSTPLPGSRSCPSELCLFHESMFGIFPSFKRERVPQLLLHAFETARPHRVSAAPGRQKPHFMLSSLHILRCQHLPTSVHAILDLASSLVARFSF